MLIQDVIALLKKNYNESVPESSIEILRDNNQRTIAKIDNNNNNTWVLRVYPTDSCHYQGLPVKSAVLNFLEHNNYPSPRIVKTTEGEYIATDSSRRTILITYIEGKEADCSQPSLHAIGCSLGHLHSIKLSVDNDVFLSDSLHSPSQQIQKSINELSRISNKVLNDTKQAYDDFMSSLNQLDALENTPKTIIHTDPCTENAVISKTGEAIFIDWDDAGIGHTLIDLGYLLCTSESDQEFTPNLRPTPDRIKVIIDGYRQYRSLTTIEQETLVHGIRFSATLYGANHLVKFIEGSVNELEWKWWWARCKAATETSNMALQYFNT